MVFLTALLGLAGALVLVANAQARLVFPSPQPLSPAGQDASGARVAVDSEGRATVIWSIFRGPIQSVRIGTDGIPGQIQNLGVGDRPQLAVDAPGRATVVWGPLGGPAPVQWGRISADGIPGDTRALPVEGSTPQVAVDPDGRATVTWQAFGGSTIDAELIQTLRLATDGTPGPIHTIAEVPTFGSVTDVAVDSQGRSTVVWQHPPTGGDEKVQAVQLAADGTPGPIHTVSKAGAVRARNPQVAVDRRGRATVVWEQRAAFRVGSHKTVQAVRLGPDGDPGAVHRLSKRKGNAGERIEAGGPQIAVDPKGRATVVWQRGPRSKGFRIQAVRLGAGGSPGNVRTVSKAEAFRPQVAVASKGRATVVWERFWERGRGVGTVGIQARRLRADGSPEAVSTLSRGHQDAFAAQIAVDPQGRPILVWQQAPFDGEVKYRIQFARGQGRR